MAVYTGRHDSLPYIAFWARVKIHILLCIYDLLPGCLLACLVLSCLRRPVNDRRTSLVDGHDEDFGHVAAIRKKGSALAAPSLTQKVDSHVRLARRSKDNVFGDVLCDKRLQALIHFLGCIFVAAHTSDREGCPHALASVTIAGVHRGYSQVSTIPG